MDYESARTLLAEETLPALLVDLDVLEENTRRLASHRGTGLMRRWQSVLERARRRALEMGPLHRAWQKRFAWSPSAGRGHTAGCCCNTRRTRRA